MFPVNVCLRIKSKRFVEEETQRKRLGSLPDESVCRTCHFPAAQPRWSICKAFTTTIHPADRMRTHNGYENVIVRDVFDLARRECYAHRVALCGASLGAYHAANIAFRHPDAVSFLSSLSGSFDISSFFDGYDDDNIYFNSPYEYLPNMPDPWKYNHMAIIIGTGEWDVTRDESYRLSGVLNSNGIKHWLDDGRRRGHDWNYWQDMLPYYLSLL